MSLKLEGKKFSEFVAGLTKVTDNSGVGLPGVKNGDTVGLDGGLLAKESDVENINNTLFEKENIPLTLSTSKGYIKTDGTIVVTNTWLYTDFLEVSFGDEFILSTVTYNTVYSIAAYDQNKQLVPSKCYSYAYTGELVEKDYIVPEGISFIRFTFSEIKPYSLYKVIHHDKVYDLEECVNGIEVFNDSIENTIECENIGAFGYIPNVNANRGFGSFSRGPWLTMLNTESNVNGLVSSVTLEALQIGKIELATGILDQNGIFVPSKKFYVNAKKIGKQTINIGAENSCYIYEGEQIFANCIGSNGNFIIGHTTVSQSQESKEYNLVYDFGENTVGVTYPENLGFMNTVLKYEVQSISSIFALKSELEKSNKEIEILKNSVIITDYDGNEYKLKIDESGNLVSIPLSYKKVLILGNSLTCHPRWGGNDGDITKENWAGARSMASTTDDVSWPYLLERILKKKHSSAVVDSVLMVGWENAGDGNRDIRNIPNTKYLLDQKLSSDIDLIVFRCGENGNVENSDVFAEEIKSLIDYCLSVANRANVVLTSLFWSKEVKDNAIYKVANDRKYQIVQSGRTFSRHIEHYGDFHVDSLDSSSYVLLDKRVLSHTNDVGFYLWTNYFASQIGYSNYVLDELYKISVNSSFKYYIKELDSVEKSLVTILTYNENQPSVTVTDEDGSSISVRSLNISSLNISDKNGTYTYAFCFIQPNKNVSISIY